MAVGALQLGEEVEAGFDVLAEDAAMFTTFEEVDAALSEVSEERYSGKGLSRKDVLLKVPEKLMKELFQRAFEQAPFAAAPGFAYVTSAGIRVPLNYRYFYGIGLGNCFNSCFSFVLDSYVSTYEGACVFVKSKQFKSYGGWMRVHRWWPRMIKESVLAGFESLSSLHFWHDGVICGSFETFVFDRADPAAKAEIQKLYDDVLAEHFAGGIDNVIEYASHVEGFKWADIPLEYHQELIEMGIRQNPYVGCRDWFLKLNNGKVIGSPYEHYQTLGAEEFYIAMYNMLFDRACLSDFKNVVVFVAQPNFKNLGGWDRVGRRWQKVFIANAILQSDKEMPPYQSLRYKKRRKEGGEVDISLSTIYLRDKSEGKAEFKAMYDSGLKAGESARANAKAEAKAKAPVAIEAQDDEKPSHWVDEKKLISELEVLAKAEKGAARDAIKWRIVGMFSGLIDRFVSERVNHFDHREDVAQDLRIDLFESFLEWFDLEKVKGSVFNRFYDRLWFGVKTIPFQHLLHSRGEYVRTALNYKSAYKAILKKRGERGDFLRDDPEVIARETGRQLSTILKARGILSPVLSFSDMTYVDEDGDENPSEEGCDDVSGQTPEEAAVQTQYRDLLMQSFEGMSPVVRLTVAQMSGVRDCVMSVPDIRRTFRMGDDLEIVAAVAKFLMVVGKGEANAYDVLYDSGSAVRKWLFEGASNGLGNYFSGVLFDKFEVREQLILRALLPIPAAPYLQERLADGLEVSHSAPYSNLSRAKAAIREQAVAVFGQDLPFKRELTMAEIRAKKKTPG